MFDQKDQDLKNHKALLNPQPGDYWHEMFCPYFIVVKVKGDDITVLSCMGGPTSFNRKHELNARISVDNAHWSFDYSKSMVVDRDWVEKAVRYGNIDGFVADVIQSEKTDLIVQEWRNYVQKEMRAKISAMEAEWETFTGWKYLKEEIL